MIIRDGRQLSRFGEDDDSDIPWGQIIGGGLNVVKELISANKPPPVTNVYQQAAPRGLGTGAILGIAGGAAALLFTVVLATRR